MRSKQAVIHGFMASAASVWLIGAAASLLPAAVFAGATVPMLDDSTHLGVATCAGSNCHGSTRPFDTSPVNQNEYFIWERNDRHARAYATLKTQQSRDIADKLGLNDAASATMCLNCHADNVPAENRGTRFLLSDGVGCEACHGGSEQWLGPHVSGLSSHANNLELGLYPTEDPQQRAQLCLGCHQGDAAHPMTHAIMGAGHPQLVFELDTFTSIQPMHYTIDADYRERKAVPNPATTWAAGQVEAALRFLSMLADQPASNSVFPELYPYDCNACHHDTDDVRWNSAMGTGQPGEVRLRDAHLKSVGDALAVRDSTLAAKWRKQTSDLHAASQQSTATLKAVAQRFQRELADPARRAASRAWSAAESRQLMSALLASAQGPQAADFTRAEQSVMAISALATSIPPADASQLQVVMDQVFAAVDDRQNYQPDALRASMAEFAKLYR